MQPKKKGYDPASLLGDINPTSAACFDLLIRRKQGAVWTALWPKVISKPIIAGDSSRLLWITPADISIMRRTIIGNGERPFSRARMFVADQLRNAHAGQPDQNMV